MYISCWSKWSKFCLDSIKLFYFLFLIGLFSFRGRICSSCSSLLYLALPCFLSLSQSFGIIVFSFQKKGIYKIKSIFFLKTAKQQNSKTKFGHFKTIINIFLITSIFFGGAFETTLFRFAVLLFCCFFISIFFNNT